MPGDAREPARGSGRTVLPLVTAMRRSSRPADTVHPFVHGNKRPRWLV
jgi:hypothetical protein